MKKKESLDNITINIVNKNNLLLVSLFTELIKFIKTDNQFLSDNKEIMINNFRIKHLKHALNIIKNYSDKITSINDLKNISGIGKGTLDRVNEILKTGTLQDVEIYKNKYKNKIALQNTMDDLMKVVGIGPKIALELINKHKIKSVNDLINKINLGKIEVNEKIDLGLKYYGKFEGKIPRAEITSIYGYLNDITNKYNNDMIIFICGSYRRELPFSSDIDLLICNLNLYDMKDINNSSVLRDYVNYLKSHKFIIDDITNKNTITKYMGFSKYKNKPIRRLDIRLIPYESLFPALMYFTGSYELNRIMRKKAKTLGYKLSEYGLFDIKTNKSIYIESELDLFNKLDMIYLSPKDRSID